MVLTIERKNSEELRRRRRELTDVLIARFSEIEGAPMTRQDLKDVAARWWLSPEERDLYDELRRVEMLLDIDE
ncbi:hypothetical protein PAB09_00535 [Corynebacterium sp. SCR221107]|uniref:hypothetical protein n=1 Tax=Corynebacterium sp. SCR221107 TaxID=3017361 RepID=UPI0022EC6360|nr:hypothetical protein [Corynebacterium sp. SCR221107]WBT08881.1 hypothetical protein PAB09_00535 [Corynebacterium sp. SCR221107]